MYGEKAEEVKVILSRRDKRLQFGDKMKRKRDRKTARTGGWRG